MLTEQMLRRSPALAVLNPVAAAHHEKTNGSGYHKGLRAAAVDPGASVLAAADIYVALTTDRADRLAFSGKDAAAELRRLALQGALEHAATDAVLAVAGHRHPLPRSRRPQHPGGLTGREAEVLRLAARSLTRLGSRSWIPDGTDPLTCMFAASGELSCALNPGLRMTRCPVSADGEEEEDEPRWLTRCGSQLTCTGEQQQLTNGAALDRWKAALGAEHRIPAGWEEARSRRPDSEVLSDAGFELAGSHEFAIEHRWTLPELAGLIRSTSFLPAAVLGDQAAAFDADLAASLGHRSDDGAFTETVSFVYELARKPD